MLFQSLALVFSLLLIAALIYKGLSPIYSVIIGCSLMMLTNNMPFVDTLSQALSTWGSALMPAVFVTLFGSAMGVLYTKAGAIDSIANWLLKPIDKIQNPDKKVVYAILAFICFRILLGLAGMVNDAVMVTMFAIGAVVFRKVDMDRRHLNAVLVIAGTIGLIVPGAPTQTNIMFSLFLPDYSATVYFVPRLLLMIVYIVLVCLLMLHYARTDRKNGIHFEQGRMMTEEYIGKLPPIWLCLIPIVVVIIAYSILNLDATIAIIFGLVSTIVCLWKYYPIEDGRSRVDSILKIANDGVLLIPIQFMLMVLPTMVMTMTPAFDWGVDALSTCGVSPYISFTLLAVILVAFSGAGAIPSICSVALAGFIGQSMSMYACVMITLWSCTVFDSLPTNASIVIQSELCDVPLKKAYPTIFTTTIVATAFVLILATIMSSLGVFGTI